MQVANINSGGPQHPGTLQTLKICRNCKAIVGGGGGAFLGMM